MYRIFKNTVCFFACGLGVASHLPNQSEFYRKRRCDENVILVEDLDLRFSAATIDLEGFVLN